MSRFGGCIVCGQTLNPDEDLRCSDCVEQHYMEQTGTKAEYIRMTDYGPVVVTPEEILELYGHYGLGCE